MYDHIIDSIAQELNINVEEQAQAIIAQLSPAGSSKRIVTRILLNPENPTFISNVAAQAKDHKLKSVTA
jgi:hypothetical protein